MSEPDQETVHEVTIERLAVGGEGVGHLANGKVVFVPHSAPGDELSVRLVEEKERFSRGEIVTMRRAASSRVEPICPVADRCGGCQWQHIDYTTQLHAKEQLVDHAFAKIVGAGQIEEIIPSPAILGYRHRVRLRFEANSTRTVIGYFKRATHELVPIDECPIASETISTAIPHLRAICQSAVRGQGLLDVTSDRDGNVVLLIELDWGLVQHDRLSRAISETSWLCGVAVSEPNRPQWSVGQTVLSAVMAVVEGAPALCWEAGGFIQSNLPANQRLVRAVVSSLRPYLGADTVLVEGFAGIGNFTVHLAPLVRRLVALEYDDAAVSRLHHNLDTYRTASAVKADVAGWFKNLGQAPDVVLIDPPRGGAKRLIPHLVRLRPAVICYVSCDLNTLARDVLSLIDGDYQVQRLIPVDMFPLTHHVELVALLTLRTPELP